MVWKRSALRVLLVEKEDKDLELIVVGCGWRGRRDRERSEKL